jgi:TetR/AcrR family transcriptional regulator
VKDNSAERIPAGERRESILAAASLVFGERGYFGATTDQIARAAGISQPYVVRMFGSKENLFLEVLDRAVDKLIEAFRTVLAEGRHADESDQDLHSRIGFAYVDLIEDRGILLSLMQAFSMGGDAVVGRKARHGFLMIYRLLRDEAGFDPETTRDFLAHGMLLNTVLGLRMPDEYLTDETARELLQSTFGTKMQMVLDLAALEAAGETGAVGAEA